MAKDHTQILKQERVKRYLLFLAALFFAAFGIALVTKATLGTTPISSIPWVLSLFLPATLGVFTLALNTAQILVALILMGRSQIVARRVELLMLIPVTILFSVSIDISMQLLSWLAPDLYITKILAMLLGCFIMALGVTGEVKADVVMMAGEYLVRAIVNKVHKEFGIVKLIFDISNVVAAIIISLCFMQGIYGVGGGTVVAALVVGPLTHVMLPYFKVFDRWFQTTPASGTITSTTQNVPFVITIMREFGSGGREMAPLIAQKLGMTFYDTQLIALAAKDSNLPEDYVERIEQTEPTSYLMSLIMHDYEVPIERSLSTIDRLFVAQSKVIRHIVTLGDCIILGRCADRVLADYPRDRILRVFCCTNMDSARKRCIDDYGMSADHIDKTIETKNRDRISHYQHFTGQRWGDAHNYDIVINTAFVSIPLAAELIVDICQKKINVVTS